MIRSKVALRRPCPSFLRTRVQHAHDSNACTTDICSSGTCWNLAINEYRVGESRCVICALRAFSRASKTSRYTYQACVAVASYGPQPEQISDGERPADS